MALETLGALAGQYAMDKISSNSQNAAAKKAQNQQFLQGLWAQQLQINWEKERAKNAHQWEMEDLKKANLNPALTATGGQGAATGSISMPTNSMAEMRGVQLGNFSDLIGRLADIKNQTKATDANSNLADAQALGELARTKNIPYQNKIEMIKAIANKVTADANHTNAMTNRNLSNSQEYLNYANAGKSYTSQNVDIQNEKHLKKQNKYYEIEHGFNSVKGLFK